jgi:hypothetical protein
LPDLERGIVAFTALAGWFMSEEKFAKEIKI